MFLSQSLLVSYTGNRGRTHPSHDTNLKYLRVLHRVVEELPPTHHHPPPRKVRFPYNVLPDTDLIRYSHLLPIHPLLWRSSTHKDLSFLDLPLTPLTNVSLPTPTSCTVQPQTFQDPYLCLTITENPVTTRNFSHLSLHRDGGNIKPFEGDRHPPPTRPVTHSGRWPFGKPFLQLLVFLLTLPWFTEVILSLHLCPCCTPYLTL